MKAKNKKIIKGIFILFLVVSLSVALVFFAFNIQVKGYAGSSMDPTYEAGCHIGFEQQVENISSIQEGDIVTYDTGEFSITHRVVKKYENFQPNNQSEYFITRSDNFVINTTKTHKSFSPSLTRQDYNEFENLKNKTVIITKGDNKKYVDPIFITEDELTAQSLTAYKVPDLIEQTPIIDDCTNPDF